MNKYRLDYWRKKDGIVAGLEFGEKTYLQIRGKIFKLLNNLVTDLAGYCLYKNGQEIERG
jgi:hypothetical protein